MGFATAIYAFATPIGQYFQLQERMWSSVVFNLVQITGLWASCYYLLRLEPSGAVAISLGYVVSFGVQLAVMIGTYYWQASPRPTTEG
jgi:hypothetical protein